MGLYEKIYLAISGWVCVEQEKYWRWGVQFEDLSNDLEVRLIMMVEMRMKNEDKMHCKKRMR